MSQDTIKEYFKRVLLQLIHSKKDSFEVSLKTIIRLDLRSFVSSETEFLRTWMSRRMEDSCSPEVTMEGMASFESESGLGRGCPLVCLIKDSKQENMLLRQRENLFREKTKEGKMQMMLKYINLNGLSVASLLWKGD